MVIYQYIFNFIWFFSVSIFYLCNALEVCNIPGNVAFAVGHVDSTNPVIININNIIVKISFNIFILIKN